MILFKDGEIFSGGVARGRQKSFEKALEQLMNYLDANGGTPDDYRIIVGYGYDEEEGKRLWMQTRAALRAKYPAAQCEVGLLQIGSTIAVHTGPYALGMGIMRRWKSSNRWIKKSSPIGRGFFCVIECYRPSVRCARREKRLSLSFRRPAGQVRCG